MADAVNAVASEIQTMAGSKCFDFKVEAEKPIATFLSCANCVAQHTFSLSGTPFWASRIVFLLWHRGNASSPIGGCRSAPRQCVLGCGTHCNVVPLRSVG